MQRFSISASLYIPDAIKKLTEKQVEKVVIKALKDLAKQKTYPNNPDLVNATATATER